MASGDITATLPVILDFNDVEGIKAALDSINLPLVTDRIVMINSASGKQILISSIVREA